MTIDDDTPTTNVNSNVNNYTNVTSLHSTDSDLTNWVNTNNVNVNDSNNNNIQQTLRRRVLRRNYRHPLLQ